MLRQMSVRFALFFLFIALSCVPALAGPTAAPLTVAVVEGQTDAANLEPLKIAAKDAGSDIACTPLPLAQALEALAQGEVDAVFGAPHDPVMEQYAAFPIRDGAPDAYRAVTGDVWWIYVTNGSNVRWDGESLTGLLLPLVAVRGSEIVPTLRTLAVPLFETKGYESCLRFLTTNRAGAVAGPGTEIERFMAGHPGKFDQVSRLESGPLADSTTYLVFSQKLHAASPDLCETLWNAAASSGE